MRENNLSLCTILESRMSLKRLEKVCNRVFGGWEWTSDGGISPRGTQIILGWNKDTVNVMVLHQTSQVMHCQVTYSANNKSFFCSFIYALMIIKSVRFFGKIWCYTKGM